MEKGKKLCALQKSVKTVPIGAWGGNDDELERLGGIKDFSFDCSCHFEGDNFQQTDFKLITCIVANKL